MSFDQLLKVLTSRHLIITQEKNGDSPRRGAFRHAKTSSRNCILFDLLGFCSEFSNDPSACENVGTTSRGISSFWRALFDFRNAPSVLWRFSDIRLAHVAFCMTAKPYRFKYPPYLLNFVCGFGRVQLTWFLQVVALNRSNVYGIGRDDEGGGGGVGGSSNNRSTVGMQPQTNRRVTGPRGQLKKKKKQPLRQHTAVCNPFTDKTSKKALCEFFLQFFLNCFL